MAVLINTKICDNAPECGGIAVCPTGALFWNAGKELIDTDNNLCVSCHLCEKECPVEAIMVADTDTEFIDLKKTVDLDERRPEDLFVERYGAMPIDEDRLVSELPNDMKGLVFVERFCDDSIQCLLHSIPVEMLITKYGCKYCKMEVEDDVDNCPNLQIFEDGLRIGEVIGYYNDSSIDDFFDKIDEIIKMRCK